MLKSISLKSKVTIVFTLIVTLLLGGFALSIYYFSKETQQNIFSERLQERAKTTANLILEKDELDSISFRKVEEIFAYGLPNEVIEVYNQFNKRVFSEPPNLNKPEKSKTYLDRIRGIQKLKEYTESTQRLSELYRDNQGNFIIIIEAPDTFGLRKLESLGNILGLSMLFSPIATALVGWLFAQRLTKPFSRIITETKNITELNLNERLTSTNDAIEIRQLVENINALLSRLEDSFQAQKVFIAHVSHEIRTPLSIILGELEIASLEKDEAARQIQLASFREEVKRLVRLSEQLLWLAHTTRDRQDIYFSNVRMDEIIFEAMQSIGRIRKADRKVNVNYEKVPTEDSVLMVKGNADLLRALFINLIENGLKYSAADTDVNINIDFTNIEVTVTVIDQGAGIAASEQTEIFKPFYRSSPSKNQVTGNGIGLYLCKQIVAVHSAQLTLTSYLGKGTIVQLTFKQAAL